MKMFKRFAAALLAGVMVLAVLTACGGNGGGGSSSNEIESKVLQYLNTVNGTSYSNNADLQSKVRAVLGKTAALVPVDFSSEEEVTKDTLAYAALRTDVQSNLEQAGVMNPTKFGVTVTKQKEYTLVLFVVSE